MLAGPWTPDRVAESGAACFERWPAWMTALALRAVAVHPAPPAEEPAALVALIEAFLEEHPAREPDIEPPTPLRRLPRPRWLHRRGSSTTG